MSEMKYRYLGNSGLKVSVLGYGNMTSGLEFFKGQPGNLTPEMEQDHFEFTKKCIEAGINFFDTAEIYGFGVSEMILGRNFKQGGWDRDELVISTKLNPRGSGIQGNSRKRMRVGIKNCLSRLQMDSVDLLYLHRPDYDVPLLEQVKTMNEFVENDYTYYWGISEFTPSQISEVFKICEEHGYAPPITEQCQYNMLYRKTVEVDYADLLDRYKLGIVAWSPLASGMLAGRYNEGVIPENSRGSLPHIKRYFDANLGWRKNNGADMLKGLKQISDELGCTQSQLALAWVVYNKDVSIALFGANKLEQVDDNLGALKVLDKLNPDILNRIEELLINRPDPPVNFRLFAPGVPRR